MMAMRKMGRRREGWMAVRVPVRYSWNWLWAVVMVLGERSAIDA